MASVVNNCLQFDGLDDYVEVEIRLPPGDMTHEVWFKTTVPDGPLLCTTNAERTASDCRLSLCGGNLCACFWHAEPIESSGLNLADGQWHHVAHVFGVAAEGQYLYVDGTLVAQGHNTMSAFTGQTHLLVGACPDASNPYFEGHIADVRIWNTIASEEQIADYMHIRLWGHEAGLLGYWPFKGGRPEAAHAEGAPTKKRGKKSRTTAVDKTRNHNGRIHGAARVADADLNLAPPPSLTNPALIFDGTDDYLEVPNPFMQTQCFTIELWAKPERLDDEQEYGIIGYIEEDGTCKPSLSLVGASGGLRYDSCAPDGTRYTGVLEHYFEQPDAWVHLAWVHDGSAYRFYRNGKLFHTVEPGPAQVAVSAQTPCYVGRLGDGWAGQLAEVRVWERARTPKQLRQQMKHRLRGNEEGLVACWPMNEGTGVVTDVTDQSHNGTVYGARLGSTTLQFKAPKTEPSGATIASSTYIARPDSIADLLADDNIFKALFARLQAASQETDGKRSITLDAATLGEFNLFSTLAELRVEHLTITDARLEFMSEEAEIDWQSKAAEQSMGLRLSGTAALLGLADAHAVVECVLDDDDGEPAAVLKLHPTSDMHLPVSHLLSDGVTLPDALQRLLDYIGNLHMACPVLAVASESVEGETEFPFNLGIDEGLNIYGVLNLTGLSGNNPFALIREWLNVDELSFHTTLCKHSVGWQVTQEAVVAKDTPVLSGVGVELVYKGATVTIDIAGHPPEIAILLSNTLLLSLNWFDAEELYLTGTMKLEPESFTGAYTLQQSPGSESAWNPFGMQGVSVQALAMQLGGTYLAPWIDNVGVATEDVTIGTTRSSLAMLVDTNDPDQFVFRLSMNETTLLELLSAFTPATFAAYQGLPRRWRRIMEQVVDIDFRDVVIHIVPAPTSIGDLAFDDEGIMVKGQMSPWGWDTEVDMVIDWDDIDIAVRVEPFSLQPGGVELFTLTGLEDDAYPRLQFARGDETDTRLYLASELVLLGTRHRTYASYEASELVVDLDSHLPFVHVSVKANQSAGTTSASGHLDLVMNLNKPGHSRLRSESELSGLMLNARVALEHSATSLQAEIAADLLLKWRTHQTRISISPRIATTLPTLPSIPPVRETVMRYGGNQVKRWFTRNAEQRTEAQPAAGHAEGAATHQTIPLSNANRSRNGEHDEPAPQQRHGVQSGNGRNGPPTRLSQEYQQVVQQVTTTVASVANRKYARRRRARLWLEDQPVSA